MTSLCAFEKPPLREKAKKFGTIKIIDSLTINMCKTYFQWSKFHSTELKKIKILIKACLFIGNV